MNDIYEVFARNLRSRRKEMKLTQRELAELMHCSEKSISKWESGSAIVPSVFLPALSEALRTEIGYFFVDNSDPSYYLGIDGGATKTVFQLVDKFGNKMDEIILGSSNPWDIGQDAAFRVLDQGIRECCKKVPMRKISVYAGISGGTSRGIQGKITAFLNNYHFNRVQNGSDSHSGTRVALGRDNGMAVMLGTGTVCIIQKDGQLVRRGGFSHLIERGGSGYCIGSDGVLAARKAEEGCGKETLIRKLILEDANYHSMLEFSSEKIGTKRGLASFAPYVLEACRMGDEVAHEILMFNMEEIANFIRSALNVLDERPCKIVLIGGLLKHADILVPMIKEHLKDELECFDISVCKEPIIKGALLLAGLPEHS